MNFKAIYLFFLQKIGYSTEIKPPKKLERSVNPDAIKTLLQRKKEIEKMQRMLILFCTFGL